MGLLALSGTPAHAVIVDDLQVSQQGARYRVTMQVQLDVDADAAYAVFADVGNLPRINPAVTMARALPESTLPKVRRVQTQVRLCISFFCRTLNQVQDMRYQGLPPGGRVGAEVLADRSDLRFGRADWQLYACGDDPQRHSCLRFDAELEPRFWVPPLIGPWVIERKLRQEAIQTSQGIERLAQLPRTAATVTP